MQKLVKRKMHYETIMPVEAYEGETKMDGLMDMEEIYFWTFWGATATVATIPYVGPYAASAMPIVDHYYHDEMVDGLQGVLETTFDQAAAEAQAGEAIRELASDASEAIMEGFIDWSSDIDYDDPIVQAYGE